MAKWYGIALVKQRLCVQPLSAPENLKIFWGTIFDVKSTGKRVDKLITSITWYSVKISFLYQEMRSTILVGLSDTTYSQALSHHCLVRVLLPAEFPPWACTYLTIEPGTSQIPSRWPCWHQAWHGHLIDIANWPIVVPNSSRSQV